MTKWVLGIGGSDHDFSTTLALGTDILVSIEEERLTRKKHGVALWYQNPIKQSMVYCLDAAGIGFADIDRIVSSDSLPQKVRREIDSKQLVLYSHHLCHAASAYMMLPRAARAAILVYDGWGSNIRDPARERDLRETFSFYLAEQGNIRCLGQTLGESRNELDDFPVGVSNSIGMLYELITAAIGFDLFDSGKTMGLASYGVPRFLDQLRSMTTLNNDMNLCFECATDSSSVRTVVEEIVEKEHQSFIVKADLACSVQCILNEVLLHCINLYSGYYPDYVCLAGGCALNTVANSELVRRCPFPARIFIPPHASDAGLGLGALFLDALERTNEVRFTFNGKALDPHVSRPGRIYSWDESQRAAKRAYPRLVLDTSISDPESLARVLASGKVLGLFNGASEIGPRALGGRSIIADPRDAQTREIINRSLKGREPFRPLAPMILSEAFGDYFQSTEQADRFMLKVAEATPRCRREAPAIVHIDGTSRVQLIDPESDLFLRRLIQEFARLTGLPILLNTSFNRRGEPIVETPDDAIDAFLGMKLDGLYLDGSFYWPAH